MVAYIRHEYTPYDTLLVKGYGRRDVGDKVEDEVQQVLAKWESPT